MHWFGLIALCGGLNFALIGIVNTTFTMWVSGIIFFIWEINIEKRKMKDELYIEKEIERVANIEKQSLSDKYAFQLIVQHINI